MTRDDEEAPVLRRSSRKRTQISYKDLVGSPDAEPTPEPTSRRKRKAGDSDREDSYGPQVEDVDFQSRRTSGLKGSREAKFYALTGDNEAKKRKFERHMKAWKDVLTKVPEELCDYKVGWGVCEGNWEGSGGERQVFERIEGYVICLLKEEVNCRVADEVMETSLKLLLGPKKSQKSVELDRYQNVMLCIGSCDESADNSILLSKEERLHS